MGRSRLPLIALLGTVGCTKQDAAAPHDAAPAEDSPWRQKGGRLNAGDESAKGSSIRALTPEERASLIPRPLPEPEDAAAAAAPAAAPSAPAAQAAPAPESSDAGTSPDYAEQRRRQLKRRSYSKGSGIQRTELRFVHGDGGTSDRNQ